MNFIIFLRSMFAKRYGKYIACVSSGIPHKIRET